MTNSQRKLFDSIIHGLSTPEEIVSNSNLSSDIRNIFLPLIGQRSDSLLLMENFNALVSKPNVSQVLIKNKFDISELELAYLFKLAKFGVRIRFEFLTDMSGVGFDFPVSCIAKKIESHYDLNTVELVFDAFKKPPNFYHFEAPDLICEARFVAQIIDGFKIDPRRILITMRTVDKRSLFFKDALSLHGFNIEIVELSKLTNEEFDVVIVVDAAQDRLALPRDPEQLLQDSDYLKINRLFGKQILRPFSEFYVEPNSLPPLQYLEPIWFLKAAHLAKKFFIVTNSILDDQYQPQLSSGLLNLNWLGNVKDARELKRTINCLEQRLNNQKKVCYFVERGRIDPVILKTKFKNKLGLIKEKPLTPTVIESFIKCPFKMFAERILEINVDIKHSLDINPIILGKIAHSALKKYYQLNESISDSMKTEYALFASKYTDARSEIFKAAIIWLEECLEILILNMKKKPPVANVIPAKFEFKLKPMSYQLDNATIFLGGIADRIDIGSHNGVIIDYKFSSVKILNSKLLNNWNSIQIPIYMRLFSNEFYEYKNIFGYSISIQKGISSRVEDISSRFEELDQDLKRILNSMLEGLVPSIPGNCKNCCLKRLCRNAAFF